MKSRRIDIAGIGNTELVKLPKTAFFCSRKVPASVVLKCYDWATMMREHGECVISGFHSQLEKDVFHFLLKGEQPIILVLGRAMYKQIPEKFTKPLSENRLLIISPISQNIGRHSEQTIEKRNKYIIDIADKIVFGSLNPQGKLYPLYCEAKNKDKRVEVLLDFEVN
jgi:predicted Rossmann fold nucleotide-binding protein DprA/Smf involved in DNA uptake